MNIIKKIHRHGLRKSFFIASDLIKKKSGFTLWRVRNAPIFANPTPAELVIIERDLHALGIVVHDYSPPPDKFKSFQSAQWFPPDYHGGMNSGVWDEKLLEHWIAADVLGLMEYKDNDIYIDIAAANSPWAQKLRERKGVDSYAIDLCEIGQNYKHLPYYRTEDATHTSFADACVKGASLQCAYEMFMKDDDINLINEVARILKPGGKIIILPLYMHTHYCAYASPDYFGKGYNDPLAKEYVRLDLYGIPSSRKYDAKNLKHRILDHVEAAGMHYKLHALRNKSEFGTNIYCHFILEIEK